MLTIFWTTLSHDDIIKWKHFPVIGPSLRGNHRSPVIHKGQWRRALMFLLFFICAWKKRLSKQSWSWWLETPFRSLWRHRSDNYHTGPELFRHKMPAPHQRYYEAHADYNWTHFKCFFVFLSLWGTWLALSDDIHRSPRSSIRNK